MNEKIRTWLKIVSYMEISAKKLKFEWQEIGMLKIKILVSQIKQHNKSMTTKHDQTEDRISGMEGKFDKILYLDINMEK